MILSSINSIFKTIRSKKVATTEKKDIPCFCKDQPLDIEKYLNTHRFMPPKVIFKKLFNSAIVGVILNNTWFFNTLVFLTHIF